MSNDWSRRVVVCGTGGQAEEVLAEFRDHIGVAYDPYSSKTDFDGVEVLNSLEVAAAAGFVEAVIAVGSPLIARRIEAELALAGFRLAAPLVSPRAHVVGKSNAIGDGTLVMPGAVITEHVEIGRSCLINMNATIGHGAILGDFVCVMPLAAISGEVRIRGDTLIGAQSFIKEGLLIASHTILGAQTGVFKDITDEGRTWIGSPAQPTSQIVQ